MSDLEDHAFERYGWRLLNRWLEITGDFEGLAGLPFYLVYRAMVRAKVNVIRLRGLGLSAPSRTELLDEVRGYLSYAESVSNPPPPSLIIMHVLSGSGKTTVSGRLIESIGAVRIRSDVERKRMTGVLDGRRPPPTDLYSGAATSENQ